MKSVMTSNKAVGMLLDALGVETSGVTDLTISFKPNDIVKVHITRVVYFDEFQAFARELKEKYGVFSLDPE